MYTNFQCSLHLPKRYQHKVTSMFLWCYHRSSFQTTACLSEAPNREWSFSLHAFLVLMNVNHQVQHKQTYCRSWQKKKQKNPTKTTTTTKKTAKRAVSQLAHSFPHVSYFCLQENYYKARSCLLELMLKFLPSCSPHFPCPHSSSSTHTFTHILRVFHPPHQNQDFIHSFPITTILKLAFFSTSKAMNSVNSMQCKMFM